MSLVSTLAKVAIGIAVAKGLGHVAKNGMPGTAGTPNAGRGVPYDGGRKAPGGLGDLMESVLGGKTSGNRNTSQTGGLGGLLEQLAGQSGANRTARTTQRKPPSGLEDLLGSLTSGSRGSTGASGGGLGDLLGGMLGGAAAGGASGGSGGGLGDLLGGMLGGAKTGGRASNNDIGGLGDIFSDVLAGNQPAAAPSPQQEVAAGLMLKAMVQAVKSDGKLDEDEKRKLMESLGDASPQEIKFVNELLAQPVDIEELADHVPEGLEEQVYLMSLVAINLDNRNEAQYLHNLAQALGMDKNLVNSIHDQAGAQRLYS